MKKTIVSLFLILIFFIASCKPQEKPKEITKLQCTQSKGNWNDCGSACAGTGAKLCIEVCVPQCECGGIAGFKCPNGYRCRLSGNIADEIGVCIKE